MKYTFTVDEDGTERRSYSGPTYLFRNGGQWWSMEPVSPEIACHLPVEVCKGTIKALTGKNMTYRDEPITVDIYKSY